MKITWPILFVGIILILFTSRVSADTCEKIYGGGPIPSCTATVTTAPTTNTHPAITVTKLVQRPGKGGDFVHAIGINDQHYSTNQTIPFQIMVTNSGNSTLQNITVVDSFPQYITYDSGSGKYDTKKNTVTLTLSKLTSGQSQTIIIVGKTASTLPSAQGTLCVTNTAKAYAGSAHSQDSSQVCIDNPQKKPNTTKGNAIISPQVYQTTPMQTSPPTGPEEIVIPLLTATGALGYFLKRKI